MNNTNLNPDQLNNLLNIAGKKLGTDPNQLRKNLESGKMNDVIKNMSPAQAAKINQLMSNPKALELMLNTPQARELLKRLSGGK
ncbi:MAG: hypothetical protein RSD67_00020 [Oscillospiraceae bacterium]